jgi:hypothetical protein
LVINQQRELRKGFMRYILLMAALLVLLAAGGMHFGPVALPPVRGVLPPPVPSPAPNLPPASIHPTASANTPTPAGSFTPAWGDLASGLVIGLIASFSSWWFLYHFLTPSINFAPSISKRPHVPTPEDGSRYGYWIRIENNGQRPVIDVEIRVRLRINYPPDYMANVWDIIDVPLAANGEITHRIPIIYPIKHKKGRRPDLRIHFNSLGLFRDKPYYPKKIKYRASRRALLLEDILGLVPSPSLDVVAFGFDEFSGARKLFMSPRYTLDDIRKGRFQSDGLTVVDWPDMDKQAEQLLRHRKSQA